MKLIIKSNAFLAFFLMLLCLKTSLSFNSKLFAQTTKTLTSKSDDVTTMAFSKTGRYFVAGGSSKLVEVWDLTNDERIKEMKGHNGIIENVAFSSKENLVASNAISKGGVFSASAELII